MKQEGEGVITTQNDPMAYSQIEMMIAMQHAKVFLPLVLPHIEAQDTERVSMTETFMITACAIYAGSIYGQWMAFADATGEEHPCKRKDAESVMLTGFAEGVKRGFENANRQMAEATMKGSA